MTLGVLLEAKKPTMLALKKALINLGYAVTSVKIKKSSTGFAFNSGTPIKTIVISFDGSKTTKANNIYRYGDDNVYKLMVDLGISSSIQQAKLYKINYELKSA